METRFRLGVIISIGFVVAAIWAFPLWYPLLNQNTLVEYFPQLELEAQPDFAVLPATVQRAYFDMLELEQEGKFQPQTTLALVRANLLEVDVIVPEPSEPFTPPSTTIVRRGSFISVDAVRGAQGTVTVYQQPNLTQVLRLDEFRATRMPDLHLILTRNPDPYDERGVGVDYINIGALQGNVGAQTYNMPQGIDYLRYPILALYSVRYDLVISTATLR